MDLLLVSSHDIKIRIHQVPESIASVRHRSGPSGPESVWNDQAPIGNYVGYIVNGDQQHRATNQGVGRMKSIRYLGLDVHSETIAIAIAESDGVQFLGTIPNKSEYIRRFIKKLGAVQNLKACYEAGPCGYAVYWELTRLGIHCDVVAPTLIPIKAGDRVKTDRKDAEKLARLYRSGELTPVWVPDAAHEALRDLVRGREAAQGDHTRARQRLGKFLLRQNRRRPENMTPWTQKHLDWLQTLEFENLAHTLLFRDYLHEVLHCKERVRRLDEAIDDVVKDLPEEMKSVINSLQALKGVAKTTAVTLVAEIGKISRFKNAKQLMSYSGTVPSEHSSGGRIHRGSITKTGNSHLRRIIIESAWHYRFKPRKGKALNKRQGGVDLPILEISWKAQNRLNARYNKLMARGKAPQQAVAAVARELLGFVWAIGTYQERQLTQQSKLQVA